MPYEQELTDKHQRKICIKYDEEEASAYHDNKEIGHIELRYDEDNDDYYLYHMDVNSSYHRSGIATTMMKLLTDLNGPYIRYPDFHAVGGSSGLGSSQYFTNEGAAFIRSCIDKKILKDIDFNK